MVTLRLRLAPGGLDPHRVHTAERILLIPEASSGKVVDGNEQ